MTFPDGLPYMRQVSSSLYTRDILRLATAIPHLGLPESAGVRVERRSAVCGSRVAVDVLFDADGRVARFGQELQACALGQASAALLGAEVVGRTGEEIEAARQALADYVTGVREDTGMWPGLHVFAAARAYPARHAAILLPFEAAAEAAARAVRSEAA